MKLKKFALTALIAASATGISAGTAGAQPVEVPSSQTASAGVVHGVDQGVGYSAQLAGDGSGVVSTLDAGMFSLTQDAKGVAVSNQAGAVIATLPLTIQLADKQFPLSPSITDGGKSLALTTPDAGAIRAVAEDPEQIRHQNNALTGAVIGAAIGTVVGTGIGAAVGGLIGAFIAIPIPFIGWILFPGFYVGALLGGGIGAGLGGLAGAGAGAGIGWIVP